MLCPAWLVVGDFRRGGSDGTPSNQERKIKMQTAKNRKGVALGSIFALVVSLFGAAPAASAATDGADIGIYPLSNVDLTNFTGLVTEDFPVYAQLKPGSSNTNFADTKVVWKIENVSGAYDVTALATTVSAAPGSYATSLPDGTSRNSVSAVLGGQAMVHNYSTTSYVAGDTNQAGQTYSAIAHVWAGATSTTLTARVGSNVAPLFVRVSTTSAVTSVSPTATVRLTAFIDEIGGQNGVLDAGEWFTTQLVTLKATSAFSPTLTVGSPIQGNSVVTASATLAGLNYSNINGKVFLALTASHTAQVFTKAGVGNGLAVTSSAITGAQASARAGVVSESFNVINFTGSKYVGIQLRYIPSGNPTDWNSGSILGYNDGVTNGWGATLVAAPGVNVLSISAVVSADVKGGGTAYDVRQNKTYTVKISASNLGVNVAAKTVTVTTGGTALATASRVLTINGVLRTVHQSFDVATDASGIATITIAASGYANSETITIDADVDNVDAADVTLTVADPSYTLTADYSNAVTGPGEAVTLGWTAEDQWGVAYTGADHYLRITRGGAGFSYATTVSYEAVTAGVGSVSFTPSPAAKTGSATVTAQLMKLVNGTYVSASSDAAITVNVSATASTFGTGLADSYSAAVSYFPSTVSWTTVTAKASNTGSAIVVTGEGLVFRASAALPTTTSNTITVRANDSLHYSFQVASLRAGTVTMSLGTGSAATSSLLVTAAAAYTSGATVTLDTTTIVPGRTKIVTGTLLDMNGNPVSTGGTASIVVTYAGTAGIPVGSMPTSTDADGQFKVSILTSATDSGTFTLTTVYNKNGATTATVDKITSVNTITVGSATTTTPSADQKVNAGSFKGYVAVYAKGYEGQRMSAKVGNDWVVVPVLASNFVRVVEFTGAGYTIAVRIYIDRVLVDTITVTTK